jgi:hypothetical protein
MREGHFKYTMRAKTLLKNLEDKQLLHYSQRRQIFNDTKFSKIYMCFKVIKHYTARPYQAGGGE